MNFAYSQYVYQCLILPLLIAAGLLGGIIFGLGKIIRKVRRAGTLEGVTSFAGIFLLIALVAMHLGVLEYGGICLLTEREKDALVISGNIERVEQLTDRQFYNKYGEAASFWIDGEMYTVFSLGNAGIGDEVEVTYLPRSRYVLQIRKMVNE